MNREGIRDRLASSILVRWLAWSVVAAAGVTFVLVLLHHLAGWPSPWGRAGVVAVALLAAGLLAGVLSRSDEVIQRLLPATVEATAILIVFGSLFLLIVGGSASGSSPHRVALRGLLAAGIMGIAYLPIRNRLHRALVRRATPQRQPGDASQGLRDRLFWVSTLQELAADARDLVRAALKVSDVEIWLRSEAESTDQSIYATSSGHKRLRLKADEQAILARAGVSGNAWLRVWLPHLAETQGDPRLRVAPIAHAEELLGFVVVHPPGRTRRFSAADDQLLAEIAHQLGLAIHNLELATALRTSRDWAVGAADKERRRIERDLHDGAQQQLVALAVNLSLARQRAADDPTSVNDALEELHGDLQSAISQLRDLAHGIYPPLLRDRGLPEALAAAARRTGIGVDLSLEPLTGRYPAQVEAAVYFCCLEALQNAAKHGGDSARTSLRLWEEDGTLAFDVRDDGPGFDLEAQVLGDGLRNMRERIGAVGGKLVVESQIGAGTRVSGRLPLRG
jgi:signal transduction histidine kinase